ncbi:MAG: TonB-dependent receptor [Proteobacteria bacterium]|nr:TonB-dependent receptor [Pseudomonadota bacterium]
MKTIVLILILSFQVTQLYAAEDGAGKHDDSIATMEEVVVAATKTREKRKDIANSVILKDSVDIAESTARSLGELLANEPGVDLRTRGNYGGSPEEIHIRGMGAEGTQVMVNGVNMNSPSYGSADISHIPLNSIEKIEVIKGPGSLLYGSGAMGGTVNIITKRPKREGTSLLAGIGYGTQDTYSISAENGMFAAGDFGYYLTANRKETKGFRDNSDLEHNDLSLNLILDKGDKLDLSLYGDYVDREYGLPGPKPPENAVSTMGLYNSESGNLLDRGSDENYKYVLQAKSQVVDWLNLAMKTDYAVLDSYNYSRYSYSGAGAITWVTNTISGVEANADITPFPWLGLLAGSEYRNFVYENNQQNLDNTGAETGSMTQAEHDLFTNGTFAELRLRPFDFLKMNAGYRHEKNSKFGYEDIARYGLVVNPLENTALKMNHGKHFKAPSMNDLFWPDDGSFTKGNPDLKPETGWHTDFTVEQSAMDDRLFVSISYFKWNINDKINWAEDPNEPTGFGWNYWTPSNIDSYQATGWEMNANIGPYYNVSLDLNLTLLDAEEERAPEASRPALYKADRQFKGSLKYFTDFGLTSVVTVNYVGARPGYYASNFDITPELELDSYWTMDLKIDQVVADHLRISLIGTNLFDSGYDTYYASFTDESWATTRQPYPGAGRSLFLSATYEY